MATQDRANDFVAGACFYVRMGTKPEYRGLRLISTQGAKSHFNERRLFRRVVFASGLMIWGRSFEESTDAIDPNELRSGSAYPSWETVFSY